MMRRLDAGAPGFDAALAALLTRPEETQSGIAETVRAIIAEVRYKGDAALRDYSARFDRVPEGMPLRIPAAEIAAARVEPAVEDALRLAAKRIRAYHEKMLPEPVDYTDAHGVRLGARWTAVDAVGLYVPGGRAVYPSTVLMNAIPAQVAGVRRLVMVMPTPDGEVNPALLVAARLAGIEEIYRIGGAQAVAALAYGTETIARVQKIAGPGNAYVAEAKRQLYGVVGIDSIAGPSEILVVSDRHSPPEWIAADLLSQAEHDPMAQSILITDDAAHADAVLAAMGKFLDILPRADIARESLARHGAVILLRSLADAPALVDRIAPEHLELAVEQPEAMMAQIRHAGAIFLGRYTPEALGDYLAGPSHVLPTSGTAAFSSGLSVSDFMKRTSFMGATAQALAAIGPAGEALAHVEGLQAHGLSLAVRRS